MLRKATDSDTIKEGDVVVAYLGFTAKRVITIQSGKMFDCKKGNYKHDRFIGAKWGSKVGEVFLLKPSMEFWTDCLPHRTQIIYGCDIALVITRLGLSPGSVVVEAGTGSGSLSHSLARAVYPTGKLLTFDFHEERSKTAAAEFQHHGLESIVVAKARDVCVQHTEGCSDEDWGFGLPANTADGLFLDVPGPHLAVPAVKHTLKPGGVFCNFSPCIEQVQRVCLKLTELGFTEIRTHEVLRREFTEHSVWYNPVRSVTREARRKRKQGDVAREENEESEQPPPPLKKLVPLNQQRGHTGYLTFAHKVPE